MLTANRRPLTADRRPPTADRRPQTADRRPPTASMNSTKKNNGHILPCLPVLVAIPLFHQHDKKEKFF
jgi:hypothetical protein